MKILRPDETKSVDVSEFPSNLESVPVPARLSAFRVLDTELGTIACDDIQSFQDRRHALEAQGTTLIAVRHGQSVANTQGQAMSGRGDSPLTEEGRKQADNAANKMIQELGGEKFLAEVAQDSSRMPVVYASPLSRAYDTAQALANKIPGLKIEVEPDLIEIDFGLCEGKQPDQVTKVYPNFGKGVDFTHRFPQGESGFDVLTRVDRFLQKVQDRHAGQKVLYFAHTMTVGMGSMLLGGVTHNDKGQVFIDRHSIPNAAPFFLAKPPDASALGPEEFLISA